MSWVRESPGVVTERVESADPTKRRPLVHCVRPVVSVLCYKVPGCTWDEFQALQESQSIRDSKKGTWQCPRR